MFHIIDSFSFEVEIKTLSDFHSAFNKYNHSNANLPLE